MKTLTVTFEQRIKLLGILGSITGPLGRIAPLLQVWEKVKFSEDEFKKIKVEQQAPGVVTYTPPYPLFGFLRVQIEDAQASAVVLEFDQFQGFKVTDIGWVEDVRKQLTTESQEMAKEA